MDIQVLIWINTVIIIFAVIVEAVATYRVLRDIAEVLHRNDNTLSRVERLSLATLERLSAGAPRAS